MARHNSALNRPLIDRLADIRAIFFDIDGVLTNATVLVLDNGERLRQINVRDELGLRAASVKRYGLGAVLSETSPGIEARLHGLGVQSVYTNVVNKLAAFERFIIDREIEARTVLYVGDDMDDAMPMAIAGVRVVPSDANAALKAQADYISPCRGGEGCLRDAIELVMRTHDLWPYPLP